MDIKETKEQDRYPSYVIHITAGELMALWQPLENVRLNSALGPVSYDCWLQLNRAMDAIAPNLVKVRS